MIQNLGLDILKASVVRAKGLHLSIFFSVKTHKGAMPFREIVTQKGSWQSQVSSYLQRHRSQLHLRDPFRVFNSESVVEFLKYSNPGTCDAVSFDVKDLFYSIPNEALFEAVREAIGTFGVLKFQNECGVYEEEFLELLRFYLRFTYVVHEGVKLIQKEGVCIGTSVAPMLSDLFLAKCDRDIESRLDKGVFRVFRYVYNYLVFFRSPKGSEREGFISKLLGVFRDSAPGLSFTSESPADDSL